MLKAVGINKRFGQIQALSDVSFEIPKGQIVGLLGQNGAGKSTLLNILSGYLPPTSGRCELNGIWLDIAPIAAKRNIGYLPERPPLYPEMTVAEYLLFCSELKGVLRKQRRRHVEDIGTLTGVISVMSRPIGKLSKGYQQRVGLAQALCGSPDILLLDEPTAGFDPSQAAEFRSLIDTLSARHTIILSSHLLPEIQAMCTRVIVLHQGRIVLDRSQKHPAGANTRQVRVHALLAQDKLLPALRSIDGVRQVKAVPVEGRGAQAVVEIAEHSPFEERLFSLMAGLDAPILYLAPEEDSLEDVFLRLTTTSLKVGS